VETGSKDRSRARDGKSSAILTDPHHRDRGALTLLARLRTYLFAGIIVTAPISITVFIVWQILEFLDNTVARFLPARYNPETYLPFGLPGVGLIVILVLLILIGWFTAGFIGRSIMRLGERILDRMPVVRTIYGTLKQIFETVFAQSSRSFREVVLFEYPRRGIWSIGFVTGSAQGEIRDRFDDELKSVFLPTTPNPTSGYLLIVPTKDLVPLDMTVEDAIKLVISGGIVYPPGPNGAPVPPPGPPEDPWRAGFSPTKR